MSWSNQIRLRQHSAQIGKRLALACASLCVIACLTGTIVSAAEKSEGPRLTDPFEQQPWTIIIRPANYDKPAPAAKPLPKHSAAPPSIAAVSGDAVVQVLAERQDTPVTAASGPAPAPMMTYQQAYDMITFSRAEYEGNPSYRHEAAMELMFGTLRPMTNVKQTMPYFSRYPDLYRYKYPVFPYPSTEGSTHTNMLWYWNPMSPNSAGY